LANGIWLDTTLPKCNQIASKTQIVKSSYFLTVAKKYEIHKNTNAVISAAITTPQIQKMLRLLGFWPFLQTESVSRLQRCMWSHSKKPTHSEHINRRGDAAGADRFFL
jgi:hypothetical protein